jgi:signal recognition particle receptor subunit beta
MSRHRLVKNLDYDDYGDDYDDYDDDEDYQDYDQQQYAAPPKQKLAPSKPTVALQIAVAGKPAMAAVGVTKPPPGWGKPNSNAATAPAVAKGILKPPPGWGKPEATASAGISKAPPGWGKPETTTSATKSGATSLTPPRKQQQQQQGGGYSDSNTYNISNQVSSKQPFKPLPEVLKNTRSQLSMVVLGHVDAGKSTLMGQLLVQVGQVNKRTAEKQQLAWLLDEDQGERDHGNTMQIATKSFTTPSHDIVILDAPGHKDFIPIMITGAAHADVALLVVAATRGEFESGFEGGGQTKEHVILARGLGVTQVLVAINKMDVDNNNDDWKNNQESRYQEIQQRVQEYLVQQQFKPARIRFVPLSGLTGENVKDCTDATLKSWYHGPTLLQAIDSFQAANRHVGESNRLLVCVCKVSFYHPSYIFFFFFFFYTTQKNPCDL